MAAMVRPWNSGSIAHGLGYALDAQEGPERGRHVDVPHGFLDVGGPARARGAQHHQPGHAVLVGVGAMVEEALVVDPVGIAPETPA